MKLEQKKSNFYLWIIILLFLFFLTFIIFYQGKLKKDTGQDKSDLSSKEAIANLSSGQYAAYAQVDENNRQADIYLYNPEDQKKNMIYALNLSSDQNIPLFHKYTQDSILINRAGGDNKDAVVKITGQLISDFVNPGYNGFLFSKNDNLLAYIEYNEAGENFYFTIHDIKTEMSNRIPNGSWRQEDLETGQLRPIYWTADEKYIYADEIVQTEGLSIGLTRINSETLEKERIKSIDDLKIVSLSIDDNQNVYGFKVDEFDSYYNPPNLPQDIYQVSLKDDSIIKHTLQSSKIGGFLEVNPLGRFVAYSYFDEEMNQNLWIYDLQEKKEKRIIDKGGYQGRVFWQDNLLLFAVSSSATQNNEIKDSSAIKIYNALTSSVQTIETITFKRGEYFNVLQPIGWFEVED